MPDQRVTSGPRVAVVGAGLMGRWHAHAARRLGADVVAVVDPDLGAAEALAGGGGTYDRLGAMLASEAPEVVHLCTPLPTHPTLIGEALEGGCHVLAEKPLAADAPATATLLKRAEDVGRLLCPVHQFPFQDGVRKVRSALDQLGRIVRIEATFCSAGSAGPRAPHPDAVVADVLPHPVSIVQSLFPCALTEAVWTAHHPAAGELLAVSEVGGGLLTIRVSMNSRPTEATLRIGGTAGSAYVDLFHGYSVMEGGAVSRRRKLTLPFERGSGLLLGAGANLVRRVAHRQPAYPGLQTLIGAFYRACAGRQAPPISSRAILEAAEIRDTLIAQGGLRI